MTLVPPPGATEFVTSNVVPNVAQALPNAAEAPELAATIAKLNSIFSLTASNSPAIEQTGAALVEVAPAVAEAAPALLPVLATVAAGIAIGFGIDQALGLLDSAESTQLNAIFTQVQSPLAVPAPVRGNTDAMYTIYGTSTQGEDNPLYGSSTANTGKAGTNFKSYLRGPGFTVKLNGGDHGQWYVYNDAGDSAQAVADPNASLAIFYKQATLYGAYAKSLQITSVVPDGTYPPPDPFVPQNIVVDPGDQTSPSAAKLKLGVPVAPPSIPQSTDNPANQAKNLPTQIQIPPGQPATVIDKNGQSTTIPASTQPQNVSVSQNGTSPSQVAVKSNTGAITATFSAAPGSPITIKIPGSQDIIIDPSNPANNKGVSVSAFNPTVLTPTTLTPTTLTPTTPSTAPTKAPLPITPGLPGIGDAANAATIAALLTPVLQAISNKITTVEKNTAPAAIEAAAAAGTCSTTKPGGCLSPLMQNAENAAGAATQAANNTNGLGNLLSSLGNNLANLAELNLLGPMNGKLDGIGSALKIFKKGFDDFVAWSQPGRLLQLLTFFTALHNAFMLSQGVKQTLVQVIQDWIQVVEPYFGIDPSSTPLDLNKLIDSTIEGFFEKLVGKSNAKKYEELFKTFNRIYQAATNLLNNMQMLIFSVTMSLQILAENTGKIGNALKKYGVVGHNAFPWMNPQPDLKNKWIGTIDTVTHKITGFIAGAFAIDAIAQGILQGRQAVDQMAKDKQDAQDELYKAYAEVKDIAAVPEHKETAIAAAKSLTDSKGAAPDLTHFGG